MSVIAWFREIGSADIRRAGGKGANLGELTAQNIPVPPGFIVTTDAYTRFLASAGLEGRIQQLTAASAKPGATQIQRLICEAAIPDDIASAILDGYRELGGGLVAVRSSATAEDLAEASFAGQHSTYLNITGEDAVNNAVRECWASLFEERAIAYRRQADLDDSPPRIAVVVQVMVQSERSGIMFTVNPVTGDSNSIVIEAILGLGEAVVSGTVTPDMYILDKGSLEILECEVSHQERKFIADENRGAGDEPNRWAPVPPHEGRSQKLSADEIRSLGRLGLRIEQHYGRPQDIEWALVAGEFSILQARPVTAAGL